MANLKASIKDIRKTKKRTTFNSRLKERIKRVVKEFNKLIETKDFNKAMSLLPRLNKTLDKAAKAGVVKDNNAQRKVSRLAKKLNKEKTANNVKASKKSS